MKWTEIDTELYIELFQLQQEELSPTEYWLEVVSILLEMDVDELEELEPSEFVQLKKSVAWIALEPPRETLPQLNGHKLIPFNKLSLGQLVDLNMFVTTAPPLEVIHKVCAILYGATSENFEVMQEVVKAQPIAPMYTALTDFLQYRSKLLENYSELFDTPDELEDGEEETEEDKQVNVYNKWAWQKMIYDLAGGDIVKAKQVTELPHIMCFNWLLMQKELKLNQPTPTAACPYFGAFQR
jgi:hypothetical protein